MHANNISLTLGRVTSFPEVENQLEQWTGKRNGYENNVDYIMHVKYSTSIDNCDTCAG